MPILKGRGIITVTRKIKIKFYWRAIKSNVFPQNNKLPNYYNETGSG